MRMKLQIKVYFVKIATCENRKQKRLAIKKVKQPNKDLNLSM